MLRIYVGIAFVMAAAPAWLFLQDLGLDLTSFDQWYNLASYVLLHPSEYPARAYCAVAWAVFAPLAGILLILLGALNRKPGIQKLKTSSKAKTGLDFARSAESAQKNVWMEKKSVTKPAPTAHQKPEPKVVTITADPAEAEQVDQSSGGRFRLLASASARMGVLGGRIRNFKLAKRADSLPGSDNEDEDTVADPVLPGRFAAVTDFLSSIRAKMSAMIPARGNSEVSLVKGEASSEAASAEEAVAFADRVIEWYGAWGNMGRQKKPAGLIEEAVALNRQIDRSHRDDVIARFGMRGFSALKALEAAAAHFGEDSDDEEATGSTIVDGLRPSGGISVEMDTETSAQPHSASDTSVSESRASEETDLARLYDDVGDESDNPGLYSGGDTFSQDDGQTHIKEINPYDLLMGSDSAGEQQVNGNTDDYGGYSENILVIEDDTHIPDTEAPIDILGIAQRRDDDNDVVNPFGVETAEPQASDQQINQAAAQETDQESDMFDIAGFDISTPADEVPETDGEDGAQAVIDDPGTMKILESVYNTEIRGPSEDDFDETNEDERSSFVMSNEEMESQILGLSADKLKIILGQREDGARALARKLEEIGLGRLTDRNPFVPAMWTQLEKAVNYQTRAFAWEHFGDQPPAALATPELRESFLIKVATSIISLREQIKEETIAEILDIKQGTEQAAWLEGRADLILQGLTSERNRSRIKALLSGGSHDNEAAAPDHRSNRAVATPSYDVFGESPQKPELPTPAESAPRELTFVETPYEDNWNIFAPTLEVYKEVSSGTGSEVYRALQAVWRPSEPNEESKFGIVDAVIGDLRVRTRERIEPMAAGVIAVMFVSLPAGQWRLTKTDEQNDARKDRFVLIGEGATDGQAIRVRDRNVEICRRWLEAKGLRCHGIIHFILSDGATLIGTDVAEGIYELRQKPWDAEEWKAAQERYITAKK